MEDKKRFLLRGATVSNGGTPYFAVYRNKQSIRRFYIIDKACNYRRVLPLEKFFIT